MGIDQPGHEDRVGKPENTMTRVFFEDPFRPSDGYDYASSHDDCAVVENRRLAPHGKN
jgi:hypothetical protein